MVKGVFKMEYLMVNLEKIKFLAKNNMQSDHKLIHKEKKYKSN